MTRHNNRVVSVKSRDSHVRKPRATADSYAIGIL